jgi:hypothetical protein
MHVPKKAFSVFFSFSAFVMLAVLIFVTPAHAQQKTVDAPACDNSIWVCPSVTDMGANNNGFHTLKLNATGLPTKDPQSGVPIQWYTVCGYDDPDIYSINNKACWK